MTEAPKTCLECGNSSLTRLVVLQDDTNNYVEIKCSYQACAYWWKEAHQEGRFISIISKKVTRAEFEAMSKSFRKNEKFRSKQCPICLQSVRAREGCNFKGKEIFCGSEVADPTFVDYSIDVHHHCISKLDGRDNLDKQQAVFTIIKEYLAPKFLNQSQR